MKQTLSSKKKWFKPEVKVLKISSETSSSMMKKAVEAISMGMLQPS